MWAANFVIEIIKSSIWHHWTTTTLTTAWFSYQNIIGNTFISVSVFKLNEYRCLSKCDFNFANLIMDQVLINRLVHETQSIRTSSLRFVRMRSVTRPQILSEKRDSLIWIEKLINWIKLSMIKNQTGKTTVYNKINRFREGWIFFYT